VRAARRNASGAVPSPASSTNRSISTNDLGEYRVFGLAPGEYVITAAAQRFYQLQVVP